MTLKYKKYIVVTYSEPKYDDLTDSDIEYMNANMMERLRHIEAGNTHHDEDIDEDIYDIEKGIVKRYFTTAESAEEYKASVIANAQKYNVSLKSVEIFDNETDPVEIFR
jgi:dGTP triphosphohydrolase